nr:YggS family pyridoxal phosphate-dependent enzyme [Ardenticatena sp.]
MDARTIEANLQTVQNRIADAAARAGRSPDEMTLVAVTKTHPPEVVRLVYDLGVRDVGENRVHEALDKQTALAELSDLRWHMIGHVQSRKVRDVVGRFVLIHSLDSLKRARRYQRMAERLGVEQVNVLLEVNVSGEASKYGFPAVRESDVLALEDAVAQMLTLPALRIHGLMTMAPFVPDVESIRPVFRATRRLRDRLAHRFPRVNWDVLSMGMSNDYEVAIEEGATMVRIGTAIFGPRLVNEPQQKEADA